MREFEMRFHWDDPVEAFYRGTKTHKQEGMLKTWKLDHETDEQYQERTRELMYSKINFVGNSIYKHGGKFGGIDSYKFR